MTLVGEKSKGISGRGGPGILGEQDTEPGLPGPPGEGDSGSHVFLYFYRIFCLFLFCFGNCIEEVSRDYFVVK